jgi:hypothetical protein
MNKVIIKVVVLVCVWQFSGFCQAIVGKPLEYIEQVPSIELESFALELQDYMNAGETDFFVYSIYMPALIDAALQGFIESLNPKPSDLRLPSIRASLANQLSYTLSSRIREEYGGSGDWTYVNHRVLDGVSHLLYRIEYDEVMDFVEFKMQKMDERWLIGDIYSFGTEISISDSIGSMIGLVSQIAQVENTENKLLAEFLMSFLNNPVKAIKLFGQ